MLSEFSDMVLEDLSFLPCRVTNTFDVSLAFESHNLGAYHADPNKHSEKNTTDQLLILREEIPLLHTS